MKNKYYLIIIFSLLALSIAGETALIIHVHNGCASCQICTNQTGIDLKHGIDGIYNPNDDYYCVWNVSRKAGELLRTDNHEMCHALVNTDYEHFCEVEE